MNTQNPLPVRTYDIPASYRVARALLRLAIRLFFPRLRLLNQEKVEQTGPAILLAAHPASLATALLLVASLDRQVHCMIPSAQVRGILGKLAVRMLGMQTFNSLVDEQHSLLDFCMGVLSNQGAMALFAGPSSQSASRRMPIADFAARLSLEACLPGQGQMQTTLFPVHAFLRSEHRTSEPLLYVDGPMEVQRFLPKVGENVAEAPRRLAKVIQQAIDANVFALSGTEAERFSQELEGLSREHLEEQWSERPDWKQRVEEFQLSSFVRTWIDEQNRTAPARLVELREAMNDYREARRQHSLGQLVVEASGAWQTSGAHTAAAWVETVLGFPVALYGLVNHIPAGIVLSVSGLLKKSSKRDPKVEWLLRIFIILSFYTVQIFLAHQWWGRATAGYYALTLPVSGAYLWRYHWLVKHRTNVLLLKARSSARSASLLRKRKEILDSFDREIQRSPQAPGAPYESSLNPAE